jgi:hypothetical protein
MRHVRFADRSLSSTPARFGNLIILRAESALGVEALALVLRRWVLSVMGLGLT